MRARSLQRNSKSIRRMREPNTSLENWLGMTLISEKRYSDAIPPLESAAKLQPGNPTVHYNLAVAYARAGRKEDAMRETALHKSLLDKIEQEKQKAAEASQQRTSRKESPKTDPPQ